MDGVRGTVAGLLVSATLQFMTCVHILSTCQASQQPQEVGRQLKPGHRKGQCPPEAWQGHGAVTPSHSRGFRARASVPSLHVLMAALPWGGAREFHVHSVSEETEAHRGWPHVPSPAPGS